MVAIIADTVAVAAVVVVALTNALMLARISLGWGSCLQS